MTLFDAGHLRDVAAALVDGELGHQARERALGHLMRCAECRAEVANQRLLKSRISGLPAPLLPADLGDRLAAISSTGVPPLGRGGLGTGRTLPAGAPSVFGGGRLVAAPVSVGRPRRSGPGASRVVRLVVGSTGLVAAGIAGVAVLGGSGHGGGPVDPAGESFVMEHAVVTGEVPLTDSAVGAAVSVSLHR